MTTLRQMRSLDQLRGFVAVARRMSVTAAADDLCITQSAMSKQIRGLEEALGLRLFDRSHRKVTLTPAGEELFRVADAAIRQLQNAITSAPRRGRVPVTVTATIGVSSLWLLPRLRAFQDRYPNIDLRIAATKSVLPLVPGKVDLAIRYCTEAHAPSNSVKLFGETIAPVATPEIAARGAINAKTLASSVLLEFDESQFWIHWADWLAPKALHLGQAKGVLRLNQYDMAIKAAVSGHGIALGRLQLLNGMLASGALALVGYASESVHSNFGFWLIPATRSPSVEVEAVRDWLVAAAHGATLVSRHEVVEAT